MPLSLQELTARARAAAAAPTPPKPRAAATPAAGHSIEPDWRAEGLVFQIEVWRCACGAEGSNPLGLMVRWGHTRYANTVRLARPRSESDPDLNHLPKHHDYTSREVALCPECCESAGFVKRLPASLSPRKAEAPATPDGFVAEWRRLTAPSTDDLPGDPE